MQAESPSLHSDGAPPPVRHAGFPLTTTITIPAVPQDGSGFPQRERRVEPTATLCGHGGVPQEKIPVVTTTVSAPELKGLAAGTTVEGSPLRPNGLKAVPSRQDLSAPVPERGTVATTATSMNVEVDVNLGGQHAGTQPRGSPSSGAAAPVADPPPEVAAADPRSISRTRYVNPGDMSAAKAPAARSAVPMAPPSVTTTKSEPTSLASRQLQASNHTAPKNEAGDAVPPRGSVASAAMDLAEKAAPSSSGTAIVATTGVQPPEVSVAARPELKMTSTSASKESDAEAAHVRGYPQQPASLLSHVHPGQAAGSAAGATSSNGTRDVARAAFLPKTVSELVADPAVATAAVEVAAPAATSEPPAPPPAPSETAAQPSTGVPAPTAASRVLASGRKSQATVAKPSATAPGGGPPPAQSATAAATAAAAVTAPNYSRPVLTLSVHLMSLFKSINARYCQQRRLEGPGPKYNNGYDDSEGHYLALAGEEILNRYTVQEVLGKGSFGTVLRCFDEKRQEMVAVKITRHGVNFRNQAKLEIDILLKLNENASLNHLVVRLLKVFDWQGHLVLVFELLSFNLYQLIKCTKYNGVSLDLVRKFAYQLVQVLYQLEQHKPPILHCDLKPENILLRSQNRSGIRLIDFGSACYENRRLYKYIQSRFYRSPEVILNLEYTTAIDRWSLGCLLVELHTGVPLFDGRTEAAQLARFEAVLGPLPVDLLESSPRLKKFYEGDSVRGYRLLEPPLPEWKLETLIGVTTGGPRGTRLGQPGHDEASYRQFYDFVSQLLRYHASSRIRCYDALRHPFIEPLLRADLQL